MSASDPAVSKKKLHPHLVLYIGDWKITSTSAERQKRSQKLAPVLVIVFGNSLVFPREIITSTGFYRCCAAGASAPVVVKNQSPTVAQHHFTMLEVVEEQPPLSVKVAREIMFNTLCPESKLNKSPVLKEGVGCSSIYIGDFKKLPVPVLKGKNVAKLSGMIRANRFARFARIGWFVRIGNSSDSGESVWRAIKIGVSIANDSRESIRANRIANRPCH